MTDALTALDATFLELEEHDHGALMSIGGVMVFDPLPGGVSPSLDDVQKKLAARLTQLPRYSQRLSSTHTGGFAWPHWEADERFDIANHVRREALPAPGSDDQLCGWTAEFFSHPLDRTRPLWEMVLLEGLQGGRWAIANKTHHCLVDGVGSVDVVDLLLDAEPWPGDEHRSVAMGANGARSPHLPEPVTQAAAAGARALSAGVHTVLHPRYALNRSRAVAGLLFHDEIIGAPRSSLNVPIGQARRFAIVRVPLGELKAIGEQFGGSVNDAALAACTAGLRRLLLARGEDPPARGLRAMVPINLRGAAERLELGNKVSSLFVELPVAEVEPAVAIEMIIGATRRLKASSAGTAASAAIEIGALAPPVLHAAVARSTYATRLFNLTITNVPGPQRTLFAFGAPMREVHPVVPLAAAHAVGIALFSYDGLVTFGINADRERMPDIDVLAFGIEQGVEDLLALGHKPTLEERTTCPYA
jgi:WS/DGAT/MGAT family acyltransferase